jgi:hypothetical protein
MQVLQKQKHKDLTLDQIAPAWSQVLALRKRLNIRQRADIKHLAHCVVGEAHGHRDSYYTDVEKYCPDCISFSMEIPYHYTAMIRTSDHIYFERTLNEFVNHFNDKHKSEFYSRLDSASR